jgi:NAD(P)-dependent dehydrogenase (short-subunit alcohol dehydrogenase family)
MSGRVDGKVAFISGAARGQGRSHAVRLAQEGADIIAVDVCGPIDNLSGVWHTVKAGVPHILSGGRGGSIILTSSVGGRKAYPHTGHYCAAKHGVIGLMRTFAVELGQHMIRVNSVLPTQVSTTMLMNEQTYRLFRPDLENPGPDDFAPISQMMHTLPAPWVDAVDISNAVLFLASDESRYITGVSLPVDAGSLLK